MRFKVFVSLLVIALALDLALLSISLVRPAARVFDLAVALAAEPPEAPSQPQPTVSAVPAAPTTQPTIIPTAMPAALTSPPTATQTPAPTANLAATVEVTATAAATASPAAQLLAAKSVAFTPADRAVRANI